MTTSFIFNPFTSNFDAVTTGLTPSEITGGTPNTVAGFDSTGALESIPSWNIDTANGGLNLALSIAPASNPNQTDTLNQFQSTINPSIDLSQYNFINLGTSTSMSGPNDFSVVTGNNTFLENDSTGTAGQVNLETKGLILGDGTNPGTTNVAIMSAGSVTVRDQHTIANLTLVNNALDIQAGSSVGNVGGFNQNITVGETPTGNITGMSLALNSTVAMPQGYNAVSLGINGADDIQYVNGFAFGLNMSAGDIPNGARAFQDNTNVQSGASINGYESLAANVQIHAGSTVNGYDAININPGIDGSLSTFGYNGVVVNGQLTSTMSSIEAFTTGTNLNSGTTVANNVYAFTDFMNAQSGSSMNSYYSFNGTPQLHSGSTVQQFTGLNIGPTLNTNLNNVTLAQLSPNGSGTATNITGLNVNLSGVSSTGRKMALSINDGVINANSTIQTQSSAGVDAANLMVPNIQILNGSPISGTTVLGLNAAALLDVQDDFGPGAIGPSAGVIGFVAQSNVASGKTMSGFSLALSGAQMSGDGTVTDLAMFHAIGSLPGSGSPIITNQYMFRGASVVPGLPTNSWGISIEDSTAENFLQKSLAIDTSTKKVSNDSIGLEIGGTTKALRLPVLTTTQRDALTALEGMEIFNTTTNQVEFYDGAIWTDGAGSGGTVTSVALADGSSSPIYSISGSPVTTSGTLTFSLANQAANKVFAGPTTGAAAEPAFRSIVAADLPTGNLTDAGTDGIVVTNGTGAVIGSGTSIAQHVADATHNGYLSSTDWSTFNGKQAAGNYITALTGDVTASGPGSAAATLATVNGNVGSFGSSTSIPSFTVNGKGLITAASGNAVIAPAGTLSGTTLNSTVVSSSLTSVGTITTGVWNGTKVDETHGGTNQSTYTTGDTLYASGSNTLSKLAIGASASYTLAPVGGVPAWVLRGVALSNSSGSVNTTSTSYVDITNLTCTITTTGRPVLITAVPDNNNTGGGNESSWIINGAGTETGYVSCDRGGTTVGQTQLQAIGPSTIQSPPGSVTFYDNQTAGTYTYKLQYKVGGVGQTVTSNNLKLLVYEI